MRLLGEQKWLWIAGIMEGEGSFMITRTTSRKNTQGYTPRIYVVNTDYSMISKLEDYAGGYVYRRSPQSGTHNEKWSIQWSGKKECTWILTKIMPYLQTDSKKIQAQLLLEFCAFYRFSMGKSLTAAELEQRDRYYRELRLAKGRLGVAVSSWAEKSI